MSGMRSFGFQRNAWSAPLNSWRCSAMDPTTVSSDDPRYALPNVPASICATTAAIPRRIERKFLSRSSHRNHDRYVAPGSLRQRSINACIGPERITTIVPAANRRASRALDGRPLERIWILHNGQASASTDAREEHTHEAGSNEGAARRGGARVGGGARRRRADAGSG